MVFVNKRRRTEEIGAANFAAIGKRCFFGNIVDKLRHAFTEFFIKSSYRAHKFCLTGNNGICAAAVHHAGCYYKRVFRVVNTAYKALQCHNNGCRRKYGITALLRLIRRCGFTGYGNCKAVRCTPCVLRLQN